jgi:nitric-oxide synthase
VTLDRVKRGGFSLATIAEGSADSDSPLLAATSEQSGSQSQSQDQQFSGGCPMGQRAPQPVPAQRRAARHAEGGAVDLYAALEFLELYYSEVAAEVPFAQRLLQVREEIRATGSYRHTVAELTFGARVAWRNSARCIGRLYWNSLRVRDRRHVTEPAQIAAEAIRHLRECTRDGEIRSTITVFAPDRPGRSGPRIHNEQLIRYAGRRTADGSVLGDPRYVSFTRRVGELGWHSAQPPGRFDVLPLLISGAGRDDQPELFDVPPDAVAQVPLRHPEYEWFAQLDLRWHAVPAISNMPLVIGGVRYPAAPFNGWYLNTEIGARNLADADRYNMLPEIAAHLGLDTSSERTLWRDRALVELVRAVQFSFDSAGIRMTDHHTESRRFLDHVDREQRAGRRCPTDWTWIVPPMSGALTPVFHRDFDPPDLAARPAFLPPET